MFIRINDKIVNKNTISQIDILPNPKGVLGEDLKPEISIYYQGRASSETIKFDDEKSLNKFLDWIGYTDLNQM